MTPARPDLPHLDIVTLSIPVFIILMLAEILWARRRAPGAYEPRDTLASLLLGLGSTVSGALTASLVVAVMAWLHQYRLFTIPWTWWAWGLCWLLDDLAYYVFHRSAHRVRWFWAAHVNHHSSQHYNLSTSLRQTWTGFIALGFIFRLPMVLIGFDPAMMVIVTGFNLVYGFWVHTEAIGRLPRWIEAVWNTPSHHRVHHATNPRYLDKNYAGVLIIWDRMFGTYEAERDDDRPRYGIVKQLGNFNLLWNAFHEWVGIARDVWSAPWRHKLGYIWREPGWSHDGSRETSATLRARWLAREETRHAQNADAPQQEAA